MPHDPTLSSYNLAFLESLYEAYEVDPNSVSKEWQNVLAQHRGPAANRAARLEAEGRGVAPRRAAVIPADGEDVELQFRVDRLIEHYRQWGHFAAQVDPLARPRPTDARFSLEWFGLDARHLDRPFHPGLLFDRDAVTLREIVGRLERTYCRRIGVEYWHLPEAASRLWLQERIEACENEVIPPRHEQLAILRSLARVDSVDRFLHSKFVGAKRFSVAGSESLVVLLEALIEEAGDLGVDEFVMGMAHRGRLNVLMNVLGKTPAEIFSEFESGDPWENLGSGDVKYHKGSHRYHTTRSGKEMYLALTFNPSHLEAITPVIAGRVRASQDHKPDPSAVLGVTLHGDAAIMGQGVFAETLNLSRLRGYTTGGTIRIVVNNQIGFTTNPEDSRSTVYCTAVADMLGVPIFHVNGDDPEAAAYVAQLAVRYRQQFRTDVVIDLVGYRRFGHNEGDEPTFTQPSLYGLIARQKPVKSLYQARLLERGTTTADECTQMERALEAEFEGALAEVRKTVVRKTKAPMHGVWERYSGGPDAGTPDVDTRISLARVSQIGEALVRVPEGFSLHRKVERLLTETTEMTTGKAPVSWAVGEHLAYGSILLDGADVRLSGQDSIRGTFNHRHAAWIDTKTDALHFPLQHLASSPGAPGSGAWGRFQVINSPLSEYAVLGFEFGYSLAAPQALVMWEAQFGDFSNGAQVIIDQFLSSSEDKWNRISGLTLMLPHGYEGQGPEHSSARLERFLQLCAEDNMQVCNLTTPSQLFHVLRRQVLRRWRKPLILMSPKSLLRFRGSFSPLEDFTDRGFRRVLDDERADPASIKRVLLMSGKVYYDVLEAAATRQANDVALVRIEQLYPLPEQAIVDLLGRYRNAEEFVWVQEEPRNMGPFGFVAPRIQAMLGAGRKLGYAGRAESASPATGSPESHKLELELLLQEAFER